MKILDDGIFGGETECILRKRYYQMTDITVHFCAIIELIFVTLFLEKNYGGIALSFLVL